MSHLMEEIQRTMVARIKAEHAVSAAKNAESAAKNAESAALWALEISIANRAGLIPPILTYTMSSDGRVVGFSETPFTVQA